MWISEAKWSVADEGRREAMEADQQSMDS